MNPRRYVDDYLHLGNRRRLVQLLKEKGISDERVLRAIGRVPRHWFVPKLHEKLAYEDRALPIKSNQTISQPFTVGYQSSLLDVAANLKVLEIGTGSGYQAAILAAMGARVFTLERHLALHQDAKELLARGSFGKLRCFLQDGFKGLPAYGPFDRILVTAGAEEVPTTLRSQLALGGKMVIPVGHVKQQMLRVTRTGEDAFKTEKFGDFRFVPFKAGLVHGTDVPVPKRHFRRHNVDL